MFLFPTHCDLCRGRTAAAPHSAPGHAPWGGHGLSAVGPQTRRSCPGPCAPRRRHCGGEGAAAQQGPGLARRDAGTSQSGCSAAAPRLGSRCRSRLVPLPPAPPPVFTCRPHRRPTMHRGVASSCPASRSRHIQGRCHAVTIETRRRGCGAGPARAWPRPRNVRGGAEEGAGESVRKRGH